LLYRVVLGSVAAGLLVSACYGDNAAPTAPVLPPVIAAAPQAAELPDASAVPKSKAARDSVLAAASPSPALRATSGAPVDLAAVRNMLEEWTRRRSGTRFKVDFSLTLRVLDAMEARTPEERRRILAELPIKLEKTIVGTDAAGRQIIRTRVIVRGVEKQSYDRVVSSRTDNTTPDVEGIDQPLEDGESLGENPISVAAVLECPEDPNDCMTQLDQEEAEIEWAAINSDFSDTESSAGADFDECVNVYECYDQTYSNHSVTALLEGDSEAGLVECAPIGFNCWTLGIDTVVKCAGMVVAGGAVGLAIYTGSWWGCFAAVGAAWLAANECAEAWNAFSACWASDYTTAFGSGLLKEETIFMGAH